MVLKAVISFIGSIVIWLVLMQLINFVMDTILGEVDIFYSNVVSIFTLTLSFITIFGIISFGVRAVRGEKEVRI